MREYLFLVVALTLNAAANILLKLATNKTDTSEGGISGALALYLSPWFIAGVTCFGLNLLSYTLALQKIPLVVAYPIMVSGGFAIIALVAWKYLGETLSAAQWAGVAKILVGVILVAREMKAMPGG